VPFLSQVSTTCPSGNSQKECGDPVKKYIIGFLIGVFFSISCFEFVHKTVEIEGGAFCGAFVGGLSEKYDPGLIYQIKVVYKAFAWPMKTIHVYITDDREARMVVEENGQHRIQEFR